MDYGSGLRGFKADGLFEPPAKRPTRHTGESEFTRGKKLIKLRRQAGSKTVKLYNFLGFLFLFLKSSVLHHLPPFLFVPPLLFLSFPCLLVPLQVL